MACKTYLVVSVLLCRLAVSAADDNDDDASRAAGRVADQASSGPVG